MLISDDPGNQKGYCSLYCLAWRDEHPLALPVTLEFAFPACKETWHLWFSWGRFFQGNRPTVWGLKDAFFSLPISRGESIHFCFEWTDPVRLQQATFLDQVAPGFRTSPTLFEKTLTANLLSLVQRFPGKIDYKKATAARLTVLGLQHVSYDSCGGYY